jgi:hypothetical protein
VGGEREDGVEVGKDIGLKTLTGSAVGDRSAPVIHAAGGHGRSAAKEGARRAGGGWWVG